MHGGHAQASPSPQHSDRQSPSEVQAGQLTGSREPETRVGPAEPLQALSGRSSQTALQHGGMAPEPHSPSSNAVHAVARFDMTFKVRPSPSSEYAQDIRVWGQLSSQVS